MHSHPQEPLQLCVAVADDGCVSTAQNPRMSHVVEVDTCVGWGVGGGNAAANVVRVCVQG